jgi:hypothetical protein
MVGIGILIVFIVDSLVWPAPAEPRLRESLAARARHLGERLKVAIAGPAESGGSDPRAPEPASESLASQLTLVGAARTEVGVSRARAGALARLAMLLETLASRARVLSEPLERPVGPAAEERAFGEALFELGRCVENELEEIAVALSASRARTDSASELEQALQKLEAARDRLTERAGWNRAGEGRVADLRDLVAVLGRAADSLSLEGEVESTQRDALSSRLRVDSFRMKIALRSGIAVVAVFLVTLILGWPINTVVAPMVFMVAAMTRGAAAHSIVVLSVIIAVGWLVADVSIVYITPLVGRAPLALLVPFCLAGAFAAVAVKKPQLALLPPIGGLIAFLSIFGSEAAPTDVYGAYNTVTYMAMGLGTGWIAARLLWPATSAGLFRQRVALQLEHCLDALREARAAGEAGRVERARNLIRSCSEQTAQLGPLHQQAQYEPVERALDPRRRAAILALATDLMDAVVSELPGAAAALLARGGAAVEPLREALRREDEALLESLRTTVAALRDEVTDPTAELGPHHAFAERRLGDLRDRPADVPDLSDEERRRVLVDLDARRRLYRRQLAIESWLADWRRAETAPT